MTKTFASSFADLAAFKRCKAQGKSDVECFKVGDNGVGAWGDTTATEDVPMCALPPEDWLERWGARSLARGKRVTVVYIGQRVVGELRDTMPHRVNIRNGCGIDLNPGFAKAFGLKPPFKVPVEWCWTDDEKPQAVGWLQRLLSFFK